jgi:hypothetical protein
MMNIVANVSVSTESNDAQTAIIYTRSVAINASGKSDALCVI